jgi:hypothetical protein
LPVATNPEQVKAITTGGAKSTKDPSYPKENNNKVEEVLPSEPQEQEMRQDFYDTTYLPFPHRNRRPQSNEQFGKIIEVIQKLYVNIPLLDTIQVPTYAKYIKDILNKKRPLPTTEVIKLIEECSATILNKITREEEGSRMPHY